jgi:hypothetical protein
LDWFKRPDDVIVVNLIVISIGAFFGFMLIALVVMCSGNWRRTSRLGSRGEGHVEMLAAADIAGVQLVSDPSQAEEQSGDKEMPCSSDA